MGVLPQQCVCAFGHAHGHFSEVHFILFKVRVLRVEFEVLPDGSQEASDR